MSAKFLKYISVFNIIVGLLLFFATSGFLRVLGFMCFIIGAYHLFFKKEKRNVKVVDDYKKVEENEIYRFEKDNLNVLRFKKTIPDDFTRWNNIGLTGEKVAGTSYREDTCKKFINGENRKVDVNYAPTEKYPEAIEVIGIWEDNKGQYKEQIGFIESEIAQEIYNTYENLPIKANLATIYKPSKNKNLGIRIFLLRKKRPSKYKK